MKKLLIIPLIACLFSCKKDPKSTIITNFGDTTTLDQNFGKATISVDQVKPGHPIADNFLGLSYETALLTKDPWVLNSNNLALIKLLKNLGAGLLRIGGDTSDETEWTGTARTATTPDNVLTTSDVDRLAAFSAACGWDVLFGLNLGDNNATLAANEAGYAFNHLGSKLYAFEFGNEPDIYHQFGLRSTSYGVTDFDQDWLRYLAAVRVQAPEVAFSGPGNSYKTDYFVSFAESEHKNVKLLDAHYYLAGPASKPGINMQTILAPNGYLKNYCQQINFEAQRFNLPYRITETNNIYGGGKSGVSDTFGSALWALDMMWTIAENGAQGINFHGGRGLFYSPIANENGVITARPEYYAMLAFKYGAAGSSVIPAAITNGQYNCSVHAASGSNFTSLTIINKELSTGISFTVNLTNKAGTVKVARLKAPAITATTGTTFAGSAAIADGTFTPKVEQHTVNSKSFVIAVPAGSAVVILAE